MTPHFQVPQVVVKLQDAVPINLQQGEVLRLAQFAALAGPLGALATPALERLLPGLEFRRLFDPLSPQEIKVSVALAKAGNPNYSGRNLENFLEVRCPVGFDTTPLVAALRTLPKTFVEEAYAVLPTENSSVVATTNRRYSEQRYLLPATVGIGVISAWLSGADGSGTRLVDMEHGWLLNREADDQHEDLPLNTPLLGGFNRRDERGHGAGALGVIAARDNNVGIVGIAPNAIVQAISPFDLSGFPGVPPFQNVASKLLRAQTKLAFGDVILLEMQTEKDKLPVETDTRTYLKIEDGSRSAIEGG